MRRNHILVPFFTKKLENQRSIIQFPVSHLENDVDTELFIKIGNMGREMNSGIILDFRCVRRYQVGIRVTSLKQVGSISARIEER